MKFSVQWLGDFIDVQDFLSCPDIRLFFENDMRFLKQFEGL